MTSTPKRLSITLDTHDPAAMSDFYCSRFGFEDAGVVAPGPIYETRELRHPGMGVSLLVRNCTPKPPCGSAVGTLWCITLDVDEPEAAAAGLPVQRREPAEGPADLIVVRDPTNYQLFLRRSGVR